MISSAMNTTRRSRVAPINIMPAIENSISA
jgi:hypothetical protein